MNKVVVGIIDRINQDGEKEWLLVRSARDFGDYTGCYYPPGGHVEEGEAIISALTREIKEELNLNAKPIAQIAVSAGDVPDQETYWWSCEVDGDIKLDPELSDAQYFNQKQIEDEIKVWPATRRFFEEYIFNDDLKLSLIHI